MAPRKRQNQKKLIKKNNILINDWYDIKSG